MLAVGQDDLAHPILGQRLTQRIQIEWRDRLVGDDHDLTALEMRTIEIRVREQTGADLNGISARTERDGQGLGHEWVHLNFFSREPAANLLDD